MDYRPPPKFKVGDVVKLRDIANNYYLTHYGNKFRVVDVKAVRVPYLNGDLGMVYWYVELDNCPTWYENRLELVRPRAPIPLEDLI